MQPNNDYTAIIAPSTKYSNNTCESSVPVSACNKYDQRSSSEMQRSSTDQRPQTTTFQSEKSTPENVLHMHSSAPVAVSSATSAMTAQISATECMDLNFSSNSAAA